MDNPCVSSCGNASAVAVPVSQGETYMIRLGGVLGAEPSGTLSASCEHKDCNGNFRSDLLDMQDGTSKDCNRNEIPDECDVVVWSSEQTEPFSEDCNENEVPDECEIFIGTGDGVCEGNGRSCDVASQSCTDGSACISHGRGPFYCLELCARDRNYNGVPDECEGACCVPWGGCEIKFEEDCLAVGGDYKGDNTKCEEGICDTVTCPDGSITWIDPEDGMTDARQPRKVDDAGFLQGIDTVMASGPEDAADLSCWSLCETLAEGADNGIAGVTEDTPGNYTITLNRRITPGAVTKITYTPDSDPPSTGTFISLPADSNADGVANTVDILALIDCCLNLVCTPPYGDYSCDIDQSLVVNSADILRLIDLLNGAGAFDRAWNLTTVHDEGECPD